MCMQGKKAETFFSFLAGICHFQREYNVLSRDAYGFPRAGVKLIKSGATYCECSCAEGCCFSLLKVFKWYDITGLYGTTKRTINFVQDVSWCLSRYLLTTFQRLHFNEYSF